MNPIIIFITSAIKTRLAKASVLVIYLNQTIMRFILTLLSCYASLVLFGQTSDISQNLSSKNTQSFIEQASSRIKKLDEQTNSTTDKVLSKLQEQEDRLAKKVKAKDSVLHGQVFSNSTQFYQNLKSKLQTASDTGRLADINEYVPYFDTLKTALAFLGKQEAYLNNSQLKDAQQLLQQYQNRLQITNTIKQEIQQREQLLKDQLQNLGFVKELKSINKQVYYYQQQLTEYKALLHDKSKLERKVIETVSSLPAFQKFWQKNSYLAQLFRLPGNSDNSAEPIPGLQTISSMQQQLQARFGNQMSVNSLSNMVNGGGSGGSIQDQARGIVQNQLSQLKDKLNASGGGSSDMDMPDFKPNQQKTKSLLERLEYGFDMQSQRGTRFLPAITDFALTLGYKIDDKKSIGIGASYKMGWGHGFDDIHFTSEGIGLRSYADLNFKGSFWITGGFEYNYYQQFTDFSVIKNIDIWQKSALAGLTKKYKVGKNKEGKIQLLYDFLHNRQIPQSQGLKFRIGWNF